MRHKRQTPEGGILQQCPMFGMIHAGDADDPPCDCAPGDD